MVPTVVPSRSTIASLRQRSRVAGSKLGISSSFARVQPRAARRDPRLTGARPLAQPLCGGNHVEARARAALPWRRARGPNGWRAKEPWRPGVAGSGPGLGGGLLELQAAGLGEAGE